LLNLIIINIFFYVDKLIIQLTLLYWSFYELNK